MPGTPSTWATNASRRGCPCRRRPIRRATTERSPSAPTVSRARMVRRRPVAVAGDDAGHGAAIVEQLVHGGALRHLGAGPPRRVQERMVQDAARYREPRRSGRRRSGEREPAVQAAAPSRGHHRAVERGARRLERGHHAEPLEQPDRFRAHVLRAGLVAGEGRAIHDADAVSHPGEQRGARAPAGPGTDDEDVDGRVGVRTAAGTRSHRARADRATGPRTRTP